MSHTPGPWYIETDHITEKPEFIRAHIDGEMFDLLNFDCDETENTNANARLIAAAPDLLHALRLMLREHDALQLSQNRTDDRWPSATLARNLINQLEIGQ